MPRQYAMPYPSDLRVSFDRRDDLPTRNRRGQYHELVQHLTDLGYLEHRVFVAWHRRREQNLQPTEAQLKNLFAGIRLFWGEDDYELKARIEPIPTEFAERMEWVEKHLPLLVFRLSRYTSFDGDLPLPTDYRVGEVSCYGRSLAFRVRVLFFLDREKLDGAFIFDRSMFPHLYSLNNSLGGNIQEWLPGRTDRRIHPGIWQLLLSWEELFGAFRRANKFVADDGGGSRQPYYLVYDLAEEPPQGEPDTDLTDREEKRRQRLERRVRRRLSRAELHADTGPNHLGVRLVQIALWRAGFYTGAVDGGFGERSHVALGNLLIQERAADRPVMRDRQLDKVRLNAADTVWVVDLGRLSKILDAYAPAGEEESEREEQEVWDSIAGSTDDADWEMDLLQQQQELGSGQFPSMVENPLRRVYYGLRGLIRGAWRAIKVVVRWVVRKVGEVAGAIFNFVKAVVKRIQEGIGLFYEGFRYFGHYVLGRPFLTRGATVNGEQPILATKLSIDFDVNNVINATASDDDLILHQRYLIQMRRGMEFFLEMVTRIIRLIGSLTTPLGWIRLGIFIARLVRDILTGRELQPVFA